MDGSIEFLDRIDRQVKLRGYRIELGEIEAALARHGAVREAVVLARADRPGERRLVAYIVPTNDKRRTTNDEGPSLEDRRLKIEDSNGDAQETLSSIFYPLFSELRGFLKERLPDYMIPSIFIALDALPLSPNGKVDRRMLPAPDTGRPDLETAYVAPQSSVEQAIAGVWQEVLQVEKVGIHDNFFDLGGSSIHLVRVHGKLQQLFEREIPLVDMFKHPTTSALASYLGHDRDQRPAAPQRVNRDERLREGKDRMKQLLKGARRD